MPTCLRLLLIDHLVITGRTVSGPEHQNGRGPKEKIQRRVSQPALLLLLSLKLVEAYGTGREIQRRTKRSIELLYW